MSVTLADVKCGLNITDNYRDDELQMYLDDVKGALHDAGVKDSYITKGIVIIGVRDLFYAPEGAAKLSGYFYQRAAQLAMK